ncbi:HoxN/HupN/NixA family nickel/cobalt transporter [Bradyrhizobium sp. S69]|uniref:HoxN/HupN/NixA family nickel/cobalt transporter n=1 Tax=Bradyrhizobium sp. S69 TaxID=1641856 RepID=UPI00131BC3CD|nr:HoxN/HupN/NixA family nickel/cobalt transporter [Bradyrhizobium sp. S69]
MSGIADFLDDEPVGLRGKTVAIYAVLIAINVLAWIWALVEFRDYPVLLGTASLAYTFGLRHGVDPDHIAAIDNVTRKLMQEGKRPLYAGFFFALGHSTVVVIASAFVALSMAALQAKFEGFKEIGSVIGTSVSALFLLGISLANIAILVSVYRVFAAVKRGDRLIEDDLHDMLAQRGLLGRMLRSLFAIITRSWHMYPLGLLFGLGFDTASEVGLLGISAAQGSAGLPVWSILVFPALFTAGMSLVDTTDGVLMVNAYGWAFIKPIRKLYYNLTITLVSIVVALLIGSVEALGLLGDKFGLAGTFWDVIAALNDNFGALGYLIVGIFALSWLVSVAVYRLRGYDKIGEPAG